MIKYDLGQIRPPSSSGVSRMFDYPLIATVKRGAKRLWGSFFDKVEDEGLYVVIKDFPYAWLSNRMNRMYGTHKFEHMYELCGIKLFGHSSIRIHKFFLPELVYIMTKAGNGASMDLVNEIIDKTWIKDLYKDESEIKVDTDMSFVEKDIKADLFDWQIEFVKQYDLRRRRAHLHGELLSFGCGLGKTITSLATMKSIGCDAVIIIAPKSTLKDVWVDHLTRFFKKPQKYFLVNEDSPKDVPYYIFNYESMDKIESVMKYLTKKNKVGIIVDESHNFLRMKSQRTQNLIALRDSLNCDNVLLMSGTPVKGVGAEMIPLLRIIDSYFDEYAQQTFIKALGVNTTLGTDILHARMNLIMHRRTMDEVYKLPELTEETILVPVKNGDQYTISNVQSTLKKFVLSRNEYHTKMMPEYVRVFDTAVTWFEKDKKLVETDDYQIWKRFIHTLRTYGYNKFDKSMSKEVTWANEYEKNELAPRLPKDLRDKFMEYKSKVKYLTLVIQGEVLGYLDRLRARMTIDVLKAVNIKKIMSRALKKVIFATTYVDVVHYLDKKCFDLGLNPICVYGETSSKSTELLNKFRKDGKSRVLIATMQTLSTGVTLTEANVVVFCNLPWRESDREQMAHRIYRIGQDTECEILTLRLDTAATPNLSDRTSDILSWSKEMTDSIVDGKKH